MDYADIAAYPETRLGATVRRLYSDPQFKALLEKARELPKLFHKENLASLFHWVKTFSSIEEFQAMMFHLINFNLRTTSDGLSASGLDNIEGKAARLFLSNHRSTTLDTAYLNYLLSHRGHETVYNAAGDNLMKTAWIQHLIRLNKGFVVKRNVQGIEEKLAEARRLSAYILDLLTDGNSVWIAHRGGRAKNGDDRTDSSVLTMLTMNGTFANYAEWTDAVNVQPMTISWEQLPQDEVLAREVAGELEPSAVHRDLLNIVGEINGWKGRIHIAFGERIQGENRREAVRALDREIQSNFRLWDANWLAFIRTHSISQADRHAILDNFDMDRAMRVLSRVSEMTPATGDAFLGMYARPVANALAHAGTVEALIEDQKRRFADAVPAVASLK